MAQQVECWASLGYRLMVGHLILDQAVEVRILVPQPEHAEKGSAWDMRSLFCSLFPTAARFWTDVSLSSGTVLRTDHLTTGPPDHLTAVRVVF